MSLSSTVQYLFDYQIRRKEQIIDNLHAVNLTGPIIVSLSEDEIVDLYLATDGLKFIDPYILKRVSNDLNHYSCNHAKLLSFLKKECKCEDKDRRLRASRYVTELSSFINKQAIQELVCLFLSENDKRIRNRAYKIIKEQRLTELIKIVETRWLELNDDKAVPIIIDYSDIDFITSHFTTLYISGYDRQLFRRCIQDESLELYPTLLELDPVLYLYYISCFNKQIGKNEVESIFKDNITDDNISMLLWSVGKLGRVDLIQYYEDWCKNRK